MSYRHRRSGNVIAGVVVLLVLVGLVVTLCLTITPGPPDPPNTYRVVAHCTNCDWSGQLLASKGVTLKETHCPQCGTRSLRKGIN